MAIPVARLKFYRRLNALKPLVESGPEAPERLVRALLYLWQERNYAHLLPRRAPYGSADYLKQPAAIEFSGWLSESPFNEAAYWLATAYAILVGDDRRTKSALYFTPPLLAERVIDGLLMNGASLMEHHWHDPACGGAAFLVPIAQRMNAELIRAGIPAALRIKHLEKKISGNDIDPTLLDISRTFLCMALSTEIAEAKRAPEFCLLNGDGLTSEALISLQPKIIACNPPYRKLKANELSDYRQHHGDVIEQQPNLYGLFINRTMQMAKSGGLVGLLTPTSFLSGQSFQKLRRKMLTHGEVLSVQMLSDRSSTFINVEQETAITILRTRMPHESVSTDTKLSVLTLDGIFEQVAEYRLPNDGTPWPIPRAVEDAELVELALKNGFSLSDYGYVARVGNLVAYRDGRRRQKAYHGPAKSGAIVPLVWAKDITTSGDLDHGRNARRKREEHFVQVKSLSDPGVFIRPTVLLQRLTSSDQKSRLVAAPVPNSWIEKFGGYVCENHVIILDPVEANAVAPELLAAILNTSVVNRVFRAISGASNVAVSELTKLSLPDPKRIRDLNVNDVDLDREVMAAYAD